MSIELLYMILRSYFIYDVEQFNNTFHDVLLKHQLLVVRVTLATLYKKQVHRGALNVELFDAIQHAMLIVLRNVYNNLWGKAAIDK